MDLRLGLSLRPLSHSNSNGVNMGKEYWSAFNNETPRSTREFERSSGQWIPIQQKVHLNGNKRVHSAEETGLQMCGVGPHSSAIPYKTAAVGWPPVQKWRKSTINGGNERERVVELEAVSENFEGNSKFVKVIMDGMALGRKVDLSAHNTYNTLALALENMFQPHTIYGNAMKEQRVGSNLKHSWLLDPSSASQYLLTYVDKDGDWMLVGDAPWKMFVKSVKRLRIAKKSTTGAFGMHGFKK